MTATGRVSWARTIVVTVLAIPFVYPFLFLLSTSLRTAADYANSPVGIPRHFTFANARYSWHAANLGHAILNSIVAVGIGVVLCCGLSSLAAFWFHRHRGRIANSLLAGVFATWLMPFVVWLIPFFVLLTNLHLINNLLVLGVVYATVNLPFGIYLLWSFYKGGIPDEVLEAAEVDGASLVAQFRHVVLPMSRPALATVAALVFVYMWGDLLISIVLIQDTSKFTVVPAAATLVSRFDAAVQQSAAAALILLIPQLLVFAFAQRSIVRGFAAGIGK